MTPIDNDPRDASGDDPLARLQSALKAAPPPTGAAKAAALRLAAENFDRLQGSGAALRPNTDRPQRAGFVMGVTAMFKALTARPVLAASTSAAALCLGLVVILPLADRVPLPGRGEGPVVGPVVGPVAGGQPKLAEEAAIPAPKAEAPATEAAPPAQTLPGTVEATNSAPPADLQRAPLDSVTEAAPAPTTGGSLAEAPAPAKPQSRQRLASGAPATASKRMAPAEAEALAATEAPLAGIVADTVMAEPAPQRRLEPGSEAFANAPANPVKVTAEEPVSTFSIDVDTASYAVVRSSLNGGYLPDAEAVRVEEMVNYFPYAYPAPEGDQAFRPSITVMPTPWNPGTRLVQIGIQGAMPATGARPPLNLVFLIDTSGSMEDANKLPLLKQSLALMLPQLQPQDQVAIVAYAGSAGQVLAPTAASDRAAIMGALDTLAAGGSTAGAEGIALAYQVAKSMAQDGEVSRVLLATDGDFNVGIDDPDALKTYIAEQRKSGVYLSVLGFGRGNLDDATMQALAQNGNGTASYIDTLTEARKVLVDQLQGALYPIADNVKIQVEWNPAEVAEYRLIGYETRALRREDFNNDKVDAGDIGAGAQVTALYEITAPDSPALTNSPLRYGAGEQPVGVAGELGFLRLRSVAPGAKASTLQEIAIAPDRADAPEEARFAVAIAGFGQLLTGATYLGDWGWDEAIALAQAGRGEDPFGYRAEAVTLMRLAESLSLQ